MASVDTTQVYFWENTMNKVLLTGASGFIGSHLAELFSSERIPLKCMVRPSSDISFLRQLNVEILEGDITDLASIQKALIDVDFVIHTAGKSSDWGRYQDFYRANVLGTLNMLRACKISKIENIIVTGSISSYGEEDCKESKNEAYPYDSHYPYFLDQIFPSAMNYYRDTKAILTQKTSEFASDNKMNITIIEPVWVYGEREFNTGFFEYMKAVQAGMCYAPGDKHNNFHVVYARDLAQAYLLAFERKLTGINRIIIGNPEAHKMYEIYSMFCKSANLKPPKLIPKCLIYPIGFWMELIATVLSRKTPPPLTRSRVNMMYDNIEYSVAKAKEMLGFEAKTSLQDGIERTVEWYKQKGLLNNNDKETRDEKAKIVRIL